MNLFGFLKSDKSKLQMMTEENRRLMHEIANLKQREMVRGEGMSEHKLRQTLKQVLAEYAADQECRVLFDERTVTGPSETRTLRRPEDPYDLGALQPARPRPNPDARKPEIVMVGGQFDGRNGNGYQPLPCSDKNAAPPKER